MLSSRLSSLLPANIPNNFIHQATTQEGVRLLTTLDDIAHHFEIQANFNLSYSHHPLLELPPELAHGLQQLPLAQQDDYFRFRVATYLSDLYDDGELKRYASNCEFNAQRSDEPLRNKTVGLYSEFYQQLQKNNKGKGYFDPGWVVLQESSDGLLVVQKAGLTMHVSRDRHLANQYYSGNHSGKRPSGKKINFGDTVSVRLPNNVIEQGCYIAVGNQGPCLKTGTVNVINLYLNLSLAGVLAVVDELTTALNRFKLPFCLAIPYNLELCQDRCDVVTLTIERNAYPLIQPSLTLFFETYAELFRENIPLFTKMLGPGFGLSEQPLHSFIPLESFAIHRFQMLAEGLIRAWRQQLSRPEDRYVAMLQSLAHHQIDPNRPYLNTGSQDDYALVVNSEIN
jgi:hypothetical protein